ncbi:MAG: D-alanyl-D-alanine carboxypeptidase [Prevotella sp.]|nr:D-alanyl-D-alanine carboxypeptidase [Prevotella sp.]
MCKTFFIAIATMLLATGLISCHSEKEEAANDSEQTRLEQARLEQAIHMDTTSLMKVVDTDTIGSRAKLDALTASAWMLVDDSTGMVISAKNAYERRYMASITKMMTALLALEQGQLTDTVEITDDVCIDNNAHVKAGDAFVTGDLIYEMMMSSDNNAAYALAKHVAGDTLAFYDMMNRKARYLDMYNTNFANPNGMPNDNNYSCAADLMKLARYCMRDSAFAAVAGTKEKEILLTDGRKMNCKNVNELLFTYKGCTGIKTGSTLQAGFCLVSSATRDGTTLTLVLLNSRTSDKRLKESATLLDHGFKVMRACK